MVDSAASTRSTATRDLRMRLGHKNDQTKRSVRKVNAKRATRTGSSSSISMQATAAPALKERARCSKRQERRSSRRKKPRTETETEITQMITLYKRQLLMFDGDSFFRSTSSAAAMLRILSSRSMLRAPAARSLWKPTSRVPVGRRHVATLITPKGPVSLCPSHSFGLNWWMALH
jgi:hypothetical protein